MLSLLLSLWSNPIARILIAIALGIAALKGYGWEQQWKGEQKIIQKSEVEGTRLDAEATKARDRVNTDDKWFASRLRRYCRDCKGQTLP